MFLNFSCCVVQPSTFECPTDAFTETETDTFVTVGLFVTHNQLSGKIVAGLAVLAN
jgi:hypothetical protein